MKYLFLLILFFTSIHLWSQNTNDTSCTNECIGITTYPFAYDTKMNDGSIAAGPSFILGGKRLCVQVGILYDFRKYTYYEYVTHLQINTVRGINLFLPLLFHYSYYINGKTNFFMTAGFMFGGRFYLENNKTREASGISFTGGPGFSHNVFKKLYIRGSLLIRYKGKIFPGMLIDLAYRIN